MSEEESIFRKIKTRLLPPSSRSFHSCMGELRDINRIMRGQNETLIAMLICCYPGWPYFPNDILGHEHFASGMMNGKIRKSLREYVDSDS